MFASRPCRNTPVGEYWCVTILREVLRGLRATALAPSFVLATSTNPVFFFLLFSVSQFRCFFIESVARRVRAWRRHHGPQQNLNHTFTFKTDTRYIKAQYAQLCAPSISGVSSAGSAARRSRFIIRLPLQEKRAPWGNVMASIGCVSCLPVIF